MKCACPPRLKHRVTIERPNNSVQDATNAQITTWSTYATVFALCRGQSAREVVQAEQVQGVGTWIVEMNKSPTTMGITGEMRLRFTDDREVTAYCDGPAMPVYPQVGRGRVRVRAMEQTA